jgi:nucleoside-diphosphate-sugar epimerase
MRIIIFGGTGTIGSAVAKVLDSRPEVLIVGNRRGALQLDIKDEASGKRLFQEAGKVDAIVSTTGNLHSGLLSQSSAEQFNVSLQGNL